MCDLTKLEMYTDMWDDYFAFVNTDVSKKLLFEDDMYIAYGCYNDLPVEDIRSWYKDAEDFRVGSLMGPEGYIAHKYNNHALTQDDVDYFIDKEVDEGMLYESNGYWFRA